MSRRTAEASKAIRLAWENERNLVLSGNGTRDWGKEEQQSIIQYGKAYDANGKAYEGHHMKSAEVYPEFQGDPKNIQFLTRDEHREAHGFNFQLPSNGYYDPVLHTTISFGDSNPIPCKVIQLTYPIYGDNKSLLSSNMDREMMIHEEMQLNDIQKKADLPTTQVKEKIATSIDTSQLINSVPKKQNTVGETVKQIIDNILEFPQNHPTAWRRIKYVGAALFAAGVVSKASEYQHSSSNSDSDYQANNYDNFDDTFANDSSEHSYPDERSSPREHMVSSHDRHYGDRTVHIESYKRGGRNKE